MRESGKPRGASVFRISLIKDAGMVVLLTTLMLVTWLSIMPEAQARQAEELETQFFEEERLSLRQTVESAAARAEVLAGLMDEAGIGRPEAERIVLEELRRDRFGTGGYGYFFVLDDSMRVILHAAVPSYEGRSIDGIIAEDGRSVGALLREALAGKDSGFFEYAWRKADTGEVDQKTTYAAPALEGRWILCGGFYASDLRASIDKYRTGSAAILGRIRSYIFAALAGFAVLAGALSLLVGSAIKRIERNLARQMRALEKYKLILDESSLVSRTNPEGIITYVNEAFCETTGYSREEAIGKNQNIERHPDTPLEAFRDMWGTIKAGKPWRGVIKNRKADGSRYYKRATIVPIADEGGEIVEYISSGQDVTEIVESRKNIESAFQTDPLTGLGNRLRLIDELGRSDSPFVALLDIEGFSGINKDFGTEAGDSVLRQAAARVLDYCAASGARAYRVHADAFAILGPSTPGRFEEMGASLGEIAVDLRGEKATLATRIGFASAGEDSFALADAALKRAKLERKRSVAIGGEEPEGRGAQENIRILRIVHEALEEDRVYPVFQPIASIPDRAIAKYECLMRLEDAEGRQLLPDEFIGISKKTGSYKRLTMRIIEKSISAFMGLRSEFSINLTVEDLLDEDTIGYLVSAARQGGAVGRLFVEIVETEELRDFERAGEALDRLRAEGIGVAVDDFGSGYSSFEYLLRLNPTYLKIDRAIVQNLFTDPRARDILASIVLFAKKAGIRTIAEYIDSNELLDEAGRLGVDYAQGWLIGKPQKGPVPAAGAGRG